MATQSASPTGFRELAQQTALYPQESLDPVLQKGQSLVIGIPKEISLQEARVALTPEAVAILTRNGHQVWVEKGAGLGARFTDREYSEAGALMMDSPEQVYQSELILKVEPLLESECELVKPGATVISALNLPTHKKDFFEKLNKKRITGIGYEFIEDRAGGLPIVRTMSEIAGSAAMLIAAEYLSSPGDGKGLILGGITGIPPTKVVILGAGTVGEFAARTGIGLGADIKVFDRHIYRLQRLKYAVGQSVYTSIIDSDTLKEAIARADVVIGAMRGENGQAPCVVTEEMIAGMNPDSVVIDVSIDQGGCFETSRITTHENPIFKEHGVIHYCVPNIASRFARTASIALSNVFLPFLLEVGAVGGMEEILFTTRWVMKGVYSYRGSLTNAHIAHKFNMPYKDLSLLMMARL